MREKTLAALEASGTTRYRPCKDLGPNMGNVYAYLGRGDTAKVSLGTARRIMEYATRHPIGWMTNKPDSLTHALRSLQLRDAWRKARGHQGLTAQT